MTLIGLILQVQLMEISNEKKDNLNLKSSTSGGLSQHYMHDAMLNHNGFVIILVQTPQMTLSL